MDIQFANISETRTKMPDLTKKALDNGLVIILKNGKPLLGLVAYKELQGYQKWKEQQDKLKAFQEWEETLPELEISDKQAKSIAEAKKDQGVIMTAEQLNKKI
jgi:hypothetical protein